MKIAIIKVTNTVIPNEWNVAKYEKNKTKKKPMLTTVQKFGAGKIFLKEVSYSNQGCMYLLQR